MVDMKVSIAILLAAVCVAVHGAEAPRGLVPKKVVIVDAYGIGNVVVDLKSHLEFATKGAVEVVPAGKIPSGFYPFCS